MLLVLLLNKTVHCSGEGPPRYLLDTHDGNESFLDRERLNYLGRVQPEALSKMSFVSILRRCPLGTSRP